MKNKGIRRFAVKNPSGSYNYNPNESRIAEIICYVVGISSTILVLWLNIFQAEKVDMFVLIIELFTLPFMFLFLGIWMTTDVMRAKKIIEKGEAVEGRVCSYKRIYVNHGRRSRLNPKPNTTVLNVSFDHNGEQRCLVNVGHKMPQKALASDKCTVYVYKDKVFVTDFELRKRGMPEFEIDVDENFI